MAFFEELPEPERPQESRYVEPQWRRIPHEIRSTVLPIDHVLHRSETLALTLTSVHVFPNGLSFSLVATRHPEVGQEPGTEPLHEAFHGGPYRPAAIRVGLLHDDGTRAEHPPLPGGGGRSEEEGDGPPAACLTARGGSGSNDVASTGFWAWPLPAAGDLTLVFQWRSAGLEETRYVLPGADLQAAAAACEEIWPGAKVPEPSQPGSGHWY